MVLSLARDGLLHAAAHITGGGFTENIPRALPAGTGRADPPRARGRSRRSFDLVAAGVAARRTDDMFATFNMGVGMVLVVDPSVPKRCWGATTLVPSRSARRDRARAFRRLKVRPGPRRHEQG